MKLTTKAITEEFAKYPFHSQAGKGGAAHVICKFALPSNTWAFYVLEAEPLTLDKYDEYATKVKAGETWGLRGIVFNVQYPYGKYTLLVLAEMEQKKVLTPIYNEAHTDIVDYVEEQAERCKDFIPCNVEDVVEDMDALTADEWAEDLLTTPTELAKFKASVRQVLEDTE